MAVDWKVSCTELSRSVSAHQRATRKRKLLLLEFPVVSVAELSPTTNEMTNEILLYVYNQTSLNFL
jgi:hypothetical protein